MSKKIGFIDLHIDEWHANNYPAWFRSSKYNCANGACKFELGYAWEESPNPNGNNLQQWCEKFQMTPAKSIEEVIANSDCLCVLAPSNPEVHERLADLPLKSGKPLYIDKPFAPSRAAALRMFDLAEKNGTPMCSSSALRFGDELIADKALLAGKAIDNMITTGGGRLYDEYAIHQLEMIVSMMGTGIKRLMRSNCPNGSIVVNLEYADGRHASVNYNPYCAFAATVFGEGNIIYHQSMANTFQNMIDSMLEFFETGKRMAPQAETIEIATALEASILAADKPNEWIML